jgi:hypothetical protein
MNLGPSLAGKLACHDATVSERTPALRRSPSVRLIETQDGAVLLDMRQRICLSMTAAGGIVWHLLETDSSEQIIDCLAAEFRDVPRQRLQDDLQEFVRHLERKELLLSGTRPESEQISKLLSLVQWCRNQIHSLSKASVKPPRFLFWKALFGLLIFDLLRLGKHFTKIHALVQIWRTAPWSSRADAVEQVWQAINYVCVWYPKRVLCLQRSAVTTCLLRSCGVPARMVIGAQKFPFKAHAWTEVNGVAINERRDVQKHYLIWERC